MVKRLVGVIVLVGFIAMSRQAFAADVYITKNGKKYHTETCPLIKSKQTVKVDEDQAVKDGLLPCSKCYKSNMVKAGKAEKQK